MKIKLADVANAVVAYRNELRTYAPADIAGDDGEPSGEIRLQVHGGTWAIHTGDAQYDQDHRGEWGASSVSPMATVAECREIARQLISEAMEMAAQ